VAWLQTCGDSDAAILRRLSVIDIVDAVRAGGDIDHGLLCQRIVMIGGTNAGASDFVQTPLNEMNGSVVLANAIRGLELSHGGLRPIPMPFQVVLLFLVCLAFSASALASERAKRHYRTLRRRRKQHNLRERLTFIWLNPIFMNGMIAFGAHLLGIIMLLVTLNFGMWGFLSAPVFAVAITQTLQEFSDG
jgi:CHASE2 domain-containing sensor protein